MAKIQGILPVYDPATKRILGAFILPLAKTFDGTETTHNIDAPNTAGPTNTVPVQKIIPNYQPINPQRKEVDWYMAAVFPDADVRSGAYQNWKNFATIQDVGPDSEWTGAASGPQFRVNWGALINGLEMGFATGAVNELAPRNTVAPVASGTGTVGQTLSVTNGTWTAGGAITYAYQWLRAGVVIAGANAATYLLAAGDSGKTVSCTVTATYSGYSNAATSNGIAVA